MIKRFEDIYEPSAVLHLSEMTFLVVEDEMGMMVHCFELEEGGAGGLRAGAKTSFEFVGADDLEGLARGPDDSLFAAASHSRQSDGDRSGDREQLVRFRFDDNGIVELGRVSDLRDAIEKELKEAGLSKKMIDKELNIEGIVFSYPAKSLTLGLREPLFGERAIILSITNPYEILENNDKVRFAPQPHLLDLGGGGVRAMTRQEKSGLYYLVSETRSKKGWRSRLWCWNGETGRDPERVRFDGLKKLQNIEGLCFFNYGGENMLLLVCDDGDSEKGRGGAYMVVPEKELVFGKK